MKELIADGFTLGGTRVTQIKNTSSGNDPLALLTEFAMDSRIAAIVLTGANPGEIYNVKSYGAVANAVVPASGNVVTGTNNLTAFNNCIAAAPSNATVFVPSGNYLVQGGLNQITSKRINFIGVGNIYTNGTDFMTFNAPGGAPRCHNVQMFGSVIGRVNMITNTLTGVQNNTGPNFSTYTGSAFKVLNDVYGLTIRANLIEGFANGIEYVVGGANGSQENTHAINRINNCANGIYLRSTDGVSWCDHLIFTGPDGGHCHINGGYLALKIDGFSGAASTNGEIYNGAFRSNEFKFLTSHMTKYVEINGDASEPQIDIVFEGGVNTGVFGTPAIQCRSVSPNFLRSPKWQGRGVINTAWMTNGMGIDGTINMPVWINNSSYVGNKAQINSSGVIIMECSPNISQATRTALPSNFKTVTTAQIIKKRVLTSAGAYTIVAEDYLIDCNAASGVVTVNMPSVTTNVQRPIIIRNITSGSGTVSVAGGDPDGVNTLAAGFHGLTYESDGTAWRITNKW